MLHIKIYILYIKIRRGLPRRKNSLLNKFLWNFFFLLFHFLQIVLQFFKLNIYLIKSSENTHIWLQFVANILFTEFKIEWLSEEHQK